MILAAQNQALRTKWVTCHIDKEPDIIPTFRICGLADETIAHAVSECIAFVQMDYKNVRHDMIVAAILRELCKKHRFEYAGKRCNHHMTTLTRNVEYWRMRNWQCDGTKYHLVKEPFFSSIGDVSLLFIRVFLILENNFFLTLFTNSSSVSVRECLSSCISQFQQHPPHSAVLSLLQPSSNITYLQNFLGGSTYRS